MKEYRTCFPPSFRCIPHYVTQRDVERNNCSLEPVGYRHFPRPYVSTRGCGYARLCLGLIDFFCLLDGADSRVFCLEGIPLEATGNLLPMTDQEIGLCQGRLVLDVPPLLRKPGSGVLNMRLLQEDQIGRHTPKLMVAS